MPHSFPDKPGSSVSAGPGSAPGSSDSFPQIGRVGPLKPQQILSLSLMTWLVLMVHGGLISSVFQLWLCWGRLPPLRAAGTCLVEKQLVQPLLVQPLLLSAQTHFNKCTFDLLFLASLPNVHAVSWRSSPPALINISTPLCRVSLSWLRHRCFWLIWWAGSDLIWVFDSRTLGGSIEHIGHVLCQDADKPSRFRDAWAFK